MAVKQLHVCSPSNSNASLTGKVVKVSRTTTKTLVKMPLFVADIFTNIVTKAFPDSAITKNYR